MGHERSCQGASRNRLHHRGLDLEEPTHDEELTNRGHNAAANLEDAARLRIHDEIEVALAIPDFDVLKTVPLLRKRNQALRQELESRGPDCELVRLRAKETSFNADPVAEVQQLEYREIALGKRILPHINLKARFSVRDDQEVRLAEAADAENAASRPRADVSGLQLVMRLRAVLGDDDIDRRLAVEPVRIDVETEPAKRVEVGAPLCNLIRFLVHARSSLRRMASRTPLMNRTDSSPQKVWASSRASLITTFAGVAGSCSNS